jgi:hypothetical protein
MVDLFLARIEIKYVPLLYAGRFDMYLSLNGLTTILKD